MIILAIAGVVTISAFTRHVGWDKTIRTSMERNARMDQMPPEQREALVQTTIKVTGFIAYAAPLFTGVSMVVVAAVFIFLFNNMLGASIRFSAMMGIVSYSFLPSLISGVLTMIVMFTKDPDDFDIQHPLVFNIGSWLPDGTPQWAIALGSAFDLFSFWMIALMAIGVHAAARKIGVTKAFITIMIPWAIIVIARVMYAAVSGG